MNKLRFWKLKPKITQLKSAAGSTKSSVDSRQYFLRHYLFCPSLPLPATKWLNSVTKSKSTNTAEAFNGQTARSEAVGHAEGDKKKLAGGKIL